jgi:hypothetical protein
MVRIAPSNSLIHGKGSGMLRSAVAFANGMR